MLPFVDLTARATFTGVTPKRLYEEVANLGKVKVDGKTLHVSASP